ncbi:MAG: hypothetical protein OEZ11_05040 [Gammaproteobacteria bacterium]|nr:hypothetical protein [Gammaproteobacteria bacterium]
MEPNWFGMALVPGAIFWFARLLVGHGHRRTVRIYLEMTTTPMTAYARKKKGEK